MIIPYQTFPASMQILALECYRTADIPFISNSKINQMTEMPHASAQDSWKSSVWPEISHYAEFA